MAPPASGHRANSLAFCTASGCHSHQRLRLVEVMDLQVKLCWKTLNWAQFKVIICRGWAPARACRSSLAGPQDKAPKFGFHMWHPKSCSKLFLFSSLNYQLLGLWDGSEHKGHLSPIPRTHRGRKRTDSFHTSPVPWMLPSAQRHRLFSSFVFYFADHAKCSGWITTHCPSPRSPSLPQRPDVRAIIPWQRKASFTISLLGRRVSLWKGLGQLGSCRVSTRSQWSQSCARGWTGDNLCPQRAIDLTLMWKKVFSYPCCVTR